MSNPMPHQATKVDASTTTYLSETAQMSETAQIRETALLTRPHLQRSVNQTTSAPQSLTPQSQTPQWGYLVSALSSSEQSLVLNINGNSTAPGTSIILWPLEAGSLNELWQLTPDGHLLSALYMGIYMGLGSSYDGNSQEYSVVTTQWNAGDSSQLWTLQSDGTIANQENGLVLTVAGDASSGASIIAAPAPSSPSPNSQWSWFPCNPLDAILAQPPVPFPTFTGEQETAYTYINQELGGGDAGFDLRSQYTNLAAPLSNWQTDISEIQSVPGVSSDNLQAVQNQLSAELTAASAVQLLFSNYTTFHNALFADQGARLTQLGQDVQMEDGQNTSGVGLAIFQGVLYTALEAIPVIGGVLGNLVNTAITAGLSAQSISPSPFQVAYSELWNTLYSTFEAILTQVGVMENSILTDWGKLQETYSCIISTGPDSLAWPTEETSNLITAAGPGYDLSVMQILMASKYQIYMYQDTDGSAVHDVPSYAQWVQSVGNGLWNKFWIADNSVDWDTYPSSEAMTNDIWNNGASAEDFFYGLGGWRMPVCYVYNYVVGGSSNVVATITNTTPNMLTVNASVASLQGGSIAGAASQQLAPYSSIQFGLCETDQDINQSIVFFPLNIDIEVFDPSIQGAVASFTVQMDAWSNLEGQTPWVSNQQSNSGYNQTSPVCNQAAVQGLGIIRDGYPGTVQVCVTYGS